MDYSLRAFTASDYQQLIDWIDSDELNYLWGGPKFSFPLSLSQLETHYRTPDVFPFLLSVNQISAGYVELYREASHSMRVCRVFIAKPFRGQNLSEVMLSALMDKASSDFAATEINLAVFTHNHSAKRCYQALGFTTTGIDKGIRHYNGQAWDLERMHKTLLSDVVTDGMPSA